MTTLLSTNHTTETDPTSVLDALLHQVAEDAAPMDRQEAEARKVLPELATAGVLDLGAPFNTGGRLGQMAEMISSLAERCMSTAFTVWARRMAIEYLAASSSPTVGPSLALLRSGAAPGVTAMAAAFRELSGSGSVEVRATRDGDGWLLDGSIPWASNFYVDAIVVTAVKTGSGDNMIVLFRVFSPGVQVATPFSLLALGCTASSSCTLERVGIRSTDIVSSDFASFLLSVRPTFLILQTSFCAGLAKMSVGRAQGSLGGVNSVFAASGTASREAVAGV